MLLHDVAVHAAEIEEKILEAAPLFSSVNRDSYADPRLAVVLDDARSYIDLTDARFDAIATDVTNLKYKRNPYLYTREYFRIMRDALTADGIAAAWLPVGGISFEDLRTLIATFDQVFPHTTVWFFTPFPTHFVILLGTPAETGVDLERLERRMQKVATDLASIHVDNVYQLGSMLLLGERDVDALVAGARLHTDDRPILEFSDMRQYMMVDVAPNLGRLLEYQREDRLRHFTGTGQQMETLERYFREYTRHYRDYVEQYELQMPRHRG
jgi:spermidine synthase